MLLFLTLVCAPMFALRLPQETLHGENSFQVHICTEKIEKYALKYGKVVKTCPNLYFCLSFSFLKSSVTMEQT